MSPPRTMPRTVVSIALLVLLAGPAVAQDVAAASPGPGAGASATSADADTPQAVVTRLQDALITVMKRADELGFQGRYDYLRPVVTETFDVPFMGSKSVGRHWASLTPEQQADWLSKFTGYLAANYAGNFTGWDGESFEVLGEQPAARDTQVVLTKLLVPGDEDVVLNYRLRADDAGRWRIIDIYLKGTVSELALRRSDFSTTLKEKGFAELTMAIDKKIDELRKKGGG